MSIFAQNVPLISPMFLNRSLVFPFLLFSSISSAPRHALSVVPNLGPPDVLGLQLPEAYTTTSSGQDFWELKFKNIWRPKVEDHCFREHVTPPVLIKLPWLSIYLHAKVLIYKSLNRLSPGHLRDCFLPYNLVQSMRYSMELLLFFCIPSTKTGGHVLSSSIFMVEVSSKEN